MEMSATKPRTLYRRMGEDVAILQAANSLDPTRLGLLGRFAG